MNDSKADVKDRPEKIINTGCCHDCGGRCVLKAHVKDVHKIILKYKNS